jgi:nitric oxide reductase subunit B
MKLKSHWIALIVVVLASFAVLLFEKRRLDQNLPPIPAMVMTDDGKVVVSGEEIRRGQDTWQSLGGQQIGSIWGHGAYVAPDWTADYLHRESVAMLDAYAKRDGAASYDALSAEQKAALRERLRGAMRTNRYDAATDTLRIPAERAAAFD